MNNQNGKINLWLVIVLVLVIVAAVFVWYRYYSTTWQSAVDEKTAAPISEGDTVSDIESDLKATDLGDLDDDFRSVDKDISGF